MKNSIALLSCLFISIISLAQEVETESFATGFNSPVDIQNAGDERLFIVEQGGRIKILNDDGTTNGTPFLNISSIISTGSERGLLGLAFHPEYTDNGYFFINYTNNSGATEIARYSVDGSDPDIANPDSAFSIIEISQPYSNHNGGAIQFGADGYLYIGTGDGGSGGDPGNRAQNLNTLLGKMLRIDINTTNGENNYAIPNDNPFIGNESALDEIWAYGLRNPWRFSFDSETDELWIGDVGQGSIEEVNRVSLDDAGLNYGWRCYEGSQEYNTGGCPDASELTFPVGEYNHSGGNCSITGGYVYRGSMYKDIYGLYFYADYCSGDIGTIDSSNNLINHGDFGGNWSAFGVDSSGELYVADVVSGNVKKVIGGELFSTSDFDTDEFYLIPNPVSDSLHVSLNNSIIQTIVIYDLKGSELITKNKVSSSEKTISVSSLTSGIYIVKIISKNGIELVKKLVVK